MAHFVLELASKEFPDLKIHSGEGDFPHILMVFIIITGSSLGKSSTTCRILGDPFLKLGHLELRCPGSQQRKQSPFSML